MKDSYGSLRPSVAMSAPGMRHSIRPRRHVDREWREEIEEAMPQDGHTAQPPAVESAPRWSDLPLLPEEHAGRGSALSLTGRLNDVPSAKAFDLLRTRLRQTTQEHNWRNIAITAPTRHCGNTFTAINLALSLSRIPGSRTLLMDLNMRNPGIAEALGIAPARPIRGLLDGTGEIVDHVMRVSDTLALGLNDRAESEPAAALLDPRAGLSLAQTRAALRPDIVLYDMPPMLTHDDVTAFLPQLDGVLLVSDGTQTMAPQLLECERMLDGQVPLLGVVLNRARASSLRTRH